MNNFMNIPELIFKLGGTGSVSKLLKTNPSTISNWKKNNKIPKSYIWINSLPVNAMGKVQKKDLRDKYDKILLGNLK